MTPLTIRNADQMAWRRINPSREARMQNDRDRSIVSSAMMVGPPLFRVRAWTGESLAGMICTGNVIESFALGIPIRERYGEFCARDTYSCVW